MSTTFPRLEGNPALLGRLTGHDPLWALSDLPKRLAANERKKVHLWFQFDATGGAATPSFPVFFADRRTEILSAKVHWVSVTVADNSSWQLVNDSTDLFADPEDVDQADTGETQEPALLDGTTTLEAGGELNLSLAVANTAIIVGILYLEYAVEELPNLTVLGG